MRWCGLWGFGVSSSTRRSLRPTGPSQMCGGTSVRTALHTGKPPALPFLQFLVKETILLLVVGAEPGTVPFHDAVLFQSPEKGHLVSVLSLAFLPTQAFIPSCWDSKSPSAFCPDLIPLSRLWSVSFLGCRGRRGNVPLTCACVSLSPKEKARVPQLNVSVLCPLLSLSLPW